MNEAATEPPLFFRMEVAMKKAIIYMAVACLMLTAIPSFAIADSDNTTVREYTFKSKTRTGDDEKIAKEITKDGEKYILTDVKYEVIGTDKPVTRRANFDNLTARAVPATRSFTIKGKRQELKLKDASYEDVTKTITQTYTNNRQRPSVPQTINKTVNGKTFTATLVDVNRSKQNTPFTVTGKFTGDEDATYYFQGEALSLKAGSPVWDGYETAIKNYLDLDRSCTLTSGKWAGPYTREGENTVRYATYQGTRPTYTATGTYTYDTISASAIYSTDPEGETEYNIRAMATYTLEDDFPLAAILIGAAVGLALLSLVIALILHTLKKKKKEEMV